ncbi:hypothetical protein AO896_04100 [Pseudomonas aeruginosa]|uniref:Uncharacterized protein n=2 Tax=Pseudomonas aeruginosa group TaxID=136841 RepID=A0ABD7JRZ6_PSEAI|nr:HAD-superfamily hydrolase subfamily IA, variant 3 [Pseudomonas aeruginosa PA7]KSC37393.1 hypothetical protein AO882_27120 [Pseudomonas paraeruginosa]KSC93226.1 hypothetical protein AO896_04100 [Pseudomonas aeruginosa]KSD27937.1 hypothetical protein AO898_04105 [Pseudomonas aeruginosa]KSG43090.1 hypothetical protein AO955_28155 [Pseudomonas aeruginosa]
MDPFDILVCGEISAAYSVRGFACRPDGRGSRRSSALEQAGVEAATTLFIDDHLPNVESARTLGIVAEHYDGSAACLERIRACLA